MIQNNSFTFPPFGEDSLFRRTAKDAFSRGRSLFVVSTLALAFAFLGNSANASPITLDWSATAGSSAWATGTNWVGNAASTSDLVTNIARFNKTSYANQPNAGTTSIAGIQSGDGVSATTAALTISSTVLSIGGSGIQLFSNSNTATFSNPVRIGASQNFENDSSNLLQFNGTLSNMANVSPFVITLNGSGSGGTFFNQAISDGGTTGTLGINVNTTGGTTNMGNITNSFTGGFTLTQGTVSFTNAASFGGATNSITILGGTLTSQAGAGVTMQAYTGGGGVKLNGDFTLAGTANWSMGTSAFPLGSDRTITANTVGTTGTSMAGVISGAFSLTESAGSTGVLTLTGTNTFGGAGKSFTLNGGTINVNSAQALGNLNNQIIINGGTFGSQNGATMSIYTGGMSWAGDFNLGSAGSINTSTTAVSLSNNRILTMTGGNTNTVGGVISGSTFNLTVNGNIATTLALGGANTFGGSGKSLTINNGTVLLNAAQAAGSLSNQIVINGGALGASSNATLSTYTGGISAAGDFNLVGGATFNAVSTAVTLTGSRSISTSGGGAKTFGTISGSGYALNFGNYIGAIQGSVVLGATNTYTGGTNILGSAVTFNTAGSIPTAGAIVVGPGGAVTLSGAHTTLAAWLADSHLSTTSTGALGLVGNSTEAFSPSASYATLSLGSFSNSTYTGTYTPPTTTYYVGGGGATTTFNIANAFTDAAGPISRNLVVGNGGGGGVSIGSTNNYTGTTALVGGTLTLTNVASISSGSFSIGGGSSGASVLSIPTRTANISFSATTINPGLDQMVLVNNVAANQLQMGALSRSNPGGVVYFSGNTGDTALPANSKFTTTTSNTSFTGGAQTILGGWAVVAMGGNDANWAVSGTGGGPYFISPLTPAAAVTTFVAASDDVYNGAGATTSATVTINSMKIAGGAPSFTINNPLTIASGGILFGNIGANTINFNGSSTITSGNGQDLIISYTANATSTINFNPQITGSIGLTIAALAGKANVTLNNAANDFTGEVHITGNISNTGQLILGSSTAMQNATLNWNNEGGSGTLGVNGVFSFGTLTAATFGGLKGYQNFSLMNNATTSAAVALTIGNNNVSSTFNAALTGSGSLIKSGTGTFTLAIPQTYSGTTQVNGGTLRLNAGASLAASSAVTVGGASASGNPTLAGFGTVNGSLTVSAAGGGAADRVAPGGSIGTLNAAGGATFGNGSVLDYDFGTATGSSSTSISDLLAVTGNLTLPGGGTITLNLADNGGANGQGSIGAGVYKLMTYTGALSSFTPGNGVSSGTFHVGASPLPGTASYSFTNVGNEIDMTVSLSYNSWTGQANGVDGNPDSSWNTAGTSFNFAAGSSGSGATAINFANGMPVSFEDTNRVGAGSALTNYSVVVQAGGVTPGAVTFNNTGTYTFTSADSAGIAGSAGIAKINTGRVILGGPNTFTSPVAVNGGAIQISNPGALGSSTGVTVASGAALEITGGISTTNAVPLTLNGAGVTASPAGALNSIVGTNTYSGAIMLASNSTITASAGALNLTGGVTNGGFTLTVNGGGNTNIGTAGITGVGGLTKSGGGTLTLSDTNHTYSGATAVNNGTLALASGATLGNTAISVTGSATLTVPAGTSAGATGAGTAGATLSLASGTNFHLDDGTIGTFSLNQQAGFGAGNVALSLAGSNLFFDLDSATTTMDVLGVNVGKAAVSGTNDVSLNILGSSALTLGTYNLITVSGGSMSGAFVHASNGLSTKNVTVGANKYGLTLGTTGTALTLTIGNAVDIWNGGSTGPGDNNWTTGANWIGGIAPSANDSLVFAGTVRTSPNNDFAPNTNFTGITFDSSATSTFTLAGNDINLTGNVVNSSAANPIVNLNVALQSIAQLNAGAGGLTMNGVISGGFGVTIIGTGATTLTGANTFNGGLSITTGKLAVATVNDANTVGVFGTNSSIGIGGSTGTLEYTAAADAATNMPFAIAPGGTGAFQIDSATNRLTLSGAVTGATGGLKKTGPGILDLTSGSNTYGGGTEINAGTLAFTNGSIGAGPIKFTGGTLQWDGGNTQDVTLGPLSVAGSTSAIILDTNGNNVSFGTTIGNTNTGGLTKKDAGTLSLTVANSYTGTTTLNGGTVQFVSGALSTAGNITFTGGTLQYATGNTQDIATRLVGSTTAAMQIDVNGNTVTYAGAIPSSNTQGLTLSDSTGTGKLILTSSANAWTGGTTINPGATLQLGVKTNATNGGVLATSNILDNGALILAHGTSAAGNITYNGQISGSGQVVVSGAAGGNNLAVIYVLRNTGSSYSGGTVFNSGVLGIEAATNLDTILGAVPATPTTNLTFNGGQFMTYSGDIGSGQVPITLGPTRTLLINNAANSGGNAGDAYFRGGYASTITIQGQMTGTGAFNVVWDGGPIVFANAGVASGGPNNYSGNTTIGATGQDYYAPGTALLQMGAANNIPYGPGKGDLVFAVKPSTSVYGTLDLNGFNTQINGLSGAGGTVTSATPAMLTVGNNDATSTYGGTFTNAVSLTKVGAGTLTLNGSLNLSSGSTTILAGKIALGTNQQLGPGTLTINGPTASFDLGTNLLQSVGTVTVDGGGSIFGSSPSFLTTTGTFELKSGFVTVQLNGGAINKTTSGTVVFSGIDIPIGTGGPSSSTTVSGGVLQVDGRLYNNDASNVFLTAPSEVLLGNPLLQRRVSTLASPGNYAGLGATAVGGLGTKVQILSGTNSSGTDDAVTMQFRLRNSSELPGAGTSPPLATTASGLVSDVLSLTGMVNDSGTDPHETDPYVLQLSYDPSQLIGSEAALVAAQQVFLAFLDPNDGYWKNAVLGNIGGTPAFEGDTAWNNTFNTLGEWGVDSTNHVAWAVLNHNSQFSTEAFVAVPEPSSFILGGLGLIGLVAAARRRKAG